MWRSPLLNVYLWLGIKFPRQQHTKIQNAFYFKQIRSEDGNIRRLKKLVTLIVKTPMSDAPEKFKLIPEILV